VTTDEVEEGLPTRADGLEDSNDAGLPGSGGESVVDTAPPKQPRSWKRFFIKWAILLGFFLTSAFFAYRWLGTSTHRGSVERVYETNAEYRVEFVSLDGEVYVFGNKDTSFPYLKMDTADLHAELNGLAKSGAIVDVRVWGFRQSWFSLFPNVVDAKHVRSASARRRIESTVIAEEVLAELRTADLVEEGDDVRRRVISAVEKGIEVARRKNGSHELPTEGEEESTK